MGSGFGGKDWAREGFTEEVEMESSFRDWTGFQQLMTGGKGIPEGRNGGGGREDKEARVGILRYANYVTFEW